MRKVQEDFRWAPFEKLEGICFEEKDFRETLDGGQSFRWYADAGTNSDNPQFTGAFGNTAAKLRLDGAGEVLYSVPENASPDAARKIAEEMYATRLSDERKVKITEQKTITY